MPNTIMPTTKPKTQQNPSNVSVSQSGGAIRVGVSGVVDCPLKEDVGIAVGVACIDDDGAPEIGTMVGTYVGVGWAVGCAETVRGWAPIDCLQASSSPSILNP